MKIAALYSNGRLVTGSNHGVAFGKLTEEQQNGVLTSGFLDLDTGQFTSNEFDCIIKSFILIRHAEILENEDKLCDNGRVQAKRTADFLRDNVPLNEYRGHFSPANRCKETGEIISTHTGIDFEECPDIGCHENETPQEFFKRVDSVIKAFPAKSILISHHNFIIQLLQMASGIKAECDTVPYCSVTYISNRKIIWMARNV